MKLLLSGGGDPECVAHIDRFFIDRIDLRKPVLYIPVAWECDPSYSECRAWFEDTYSPYGIDHFEMCTDLNSVSDLNRYSAVFIGGGNTFKLLKEIRDSKFDDKIIHYLNGGGFVYGGSAGSIIFGKDIKGAAYEDENAVGLEDTKGLNLIWGFHVYCHYGNGGEAHTQNMRKRMREYSNGAAMALPEDCAVYVDNETITFLGSGALMLIEPGTE